MKINFSLMIMAGVLFSLCACQAPKTAGLSASAGIDADRGALATSLQVQDRAMIGYLRVEDILVNQRDDGFLLAQIEILNLRKRDYNCQYKFLWFGSDNMELRPGSRPWQQAILHGGETVRLQGVSPFPGAQSFKIQIRPMTR